MNRCKLLKFFFLKRYFDVCYKFYFVLLFNFSLSFFLRFCVASVGLLSCSIVGFADSKSDHDSIDSENKSKNEINVRDMGDGKVNNALQQVSLSVGESRVIDLQSSQEIRLSRRGVVEIFRSSDSAWTIVGLKPGFVSLSSDTDNFRQMYLIRVASSELTDVNEHTIIPKWICDTRGVSCDPHAGIIGGIWEDSSRYNQARRWCIRNSCLFRALLGSAARIQLHSRILELLPKDSFVEVSPLGVVNLQLDCHSDESNYRWSDQKIDSPDRRSSTNESDYFGDLKKILAGIVDSDQLIVRCRSLHLPTTYRLETKIMKINSSDLEALGFTASAWLLAKASPLQIDTNLTSRLEAAYRHRQIQSVGQPALRLLSGRTSVLRSGGEFPTVSLDRRRSNERTSWKPFGLTLTATVFPRNQQEVRLIYKLDFKTREGDHLSAHGVEGELRLPIATPVIAAALDMHTSDQQQIEQPWFAAVPIVGPLFRVRYDVAQVSHLFAWFKIASDDTPQLRDHSTEWPEAG